MTNNNILVGRNNTGTNQIIRLEAGTSANDCEVSDNRIHFSGTNTGTFYAIGQGAAGIYPHVHVHRNRIEGPLTGEINVGGITGSDTAAAANE